MRPHPAFGLQRTSPQSTRRTQRGIREAEGNVLYGQRCAFWVTQLLNYVPPRLFVSWREWYPWFFYQFQASVQVIRSGSSISALPQSEPG
jgi:hypothetical protein